MTTTLTAYHYNELSDKAKEKAVESCRDWNVDYEWWDYVEDLYRTEKLPEAGFLPDKMYFSGFWSQGDGACFTADVNVKDWMKVNKVGRKDYPSLTYWLGRDSRAAIVWIIQNNSRYVNHMTMDVRYELDIITDNDDTWNRAEQELEDLSRAILDDARDKAKDYYRALEKEYEFLTSDEAVAESIEVNEVLFWESGRLVK